MKLFESSSIPKSSTSSPWTSAARALAIAAVSRRFCSRTSLAEPAVSYAATGSIPAARRYVSVCASACGWLIAFLTSAFATPGSASSVWRTRNECSPRMCTLPWYRRSRS